MCEKLCNVYSEFPVFYLSKKIVTTSKFFKKYEKCLEVVAKFYQEFQ